MELKRDLRLFVCGNIIIGLYSPVIKDIMYSAVKKRQQEKTAYTLLTEKDYTLTASQKTL